MPIPKLSGTQSDREEAGKGEFAAIEMIRQVLGEAARKGGVGGAPMSPLAGEVWIGDDSAVLEQDGDRLLLTSDLTVAGVHADLDLLGLTDVGWRALVCALSDIAAMGGAPAHAVVGVAAPRGTDLRSLYEGIAAAATEHRCPVVGGDLSSAGQLVVAATVAGRVPEGRSAVLRSGAVPGDTLFVTAPLGSSAAGLRALREAAGTQAGKEARSEGSVRTGPLRDSPLVKAHLRPRARIAAGQAAGRGGATAMIDVSDGFAADLWHLADASGVGFELERVPVAEGASAEDALGGGEDYELVIATAEPERLVATFVTSGLPPPLEIGVCTAESGRRMFGGARLEPVGYEHPML